MKKFIKKRVVKYYHLDNKHRYLHLTVDSLLLAIVLFLIVINTYLSANNLGVVLGTQNNDINNSNELDNNPDINSKPETQASTTDSNIEKKPETIKSTNINFQSQARYYTPNGDQLGVGPLPPVFGQTTNYWIFINLADFDHDLENVVVTAKLPNNTSLTGKSSVSYGEDMSFDASTKTVKWKLGNLASQNDGLILGLAFEIKFIPTENQVGSIAPLLTNIKISAFDTISKQIIIKNNSDLTTHLIGDSLDISDGIIINN